MATIGLIGGMSWESTAVYYRLLNELIAKGQRDGELTTRMSANEIAKIYALCERALLYDWCICNGEYSLKNYAKTTMPMFLHDIRGKAQKKN